MERELRASHHFRPVYGRGVAHVVLSQDQIGRLEGCVW
jgi:hypothetical protein